MESESDFDEELASAINANYGAEMVEENARIVALYYTTLTSNGVNDDAAVELTSLWLAKTMDG